MWSLTFDRSALELDDLVIDGDPFAGSFHLPEDGLEWPAFKFRYGYAPESRDVPGRTLLAAVLDASSLPAVIYAHADTTAALKAAQAELEAAVSQWSYDVTLTVDGQSWTWAADPSWPSWGPIDSGMVRARLSRASLVIPINPPTT